MTQGDAESVYLANPYPFLHARVPCSHALGLLGFIFFGGLVIFLAREAGELAEKPHDIGPWLSTLLGRRVAGLSTSLERARQVGGGLWEAGTCWGPGCKCCLVASPPSPLRARTGAIALSCPAGQNPAELLRRQCVLTFELNIMVTLKPP